MLFIRVNAVEMCGPEKGRWVEFENEKLLTMIMEQRRLNATEIGGLAASFRFW